MNSEILQNPADPEATYREKAGKQNRGYVANVTEAVGDNGSIVTDYQFDKNTHSDAEFLDEYLEGEQKTPERRSIIADGAYASEELKEKANERNIELVTTDLTGRETKDIYADFIFTENGEDIVKCPAGNEPVSSKLEKSTGKCRASFNKSCCENCPLRDQCNPTIGNKKAYVKVSAKQSARAKTQRSMRGPLAKVAARIRNGVETIPSILRRRYDIDHMPIRGQMRMKHLFGFKIAALNFRKLSIYLNSLDECALQATMQ
jgi:hypothetical protein